MQVWNCLGKLKGILQRDTSAPPWLSASWNSVPRGIEFAAGFSWWGKVETLFLPEDSPPRKILQALTTWKDRIETQWFLSGWAVTAKAICWPGMLSYAYLSTVMSSVDGLSYQSTHVNQIAYVLPNVTVNELYFSPRHHCLSWWEQIVKPSLLGLQGST